MDITNIINAERTKQQSINDAREKRQKEILLESFAKCEEICKELYQFTDYGFSFDIVRYTSNSYGSYYGYQCYKVKMEYHGCHFAFLYPCTGCKWDFYSHQLDYSFGGTHYTYESAAKSIAKRIRFA